MKANSSKYIFAVGRRKTATARVRLFKGSSDSLINDQVAKNDLLNRPFIVTDTLGKFFFTAKTVGGGVQGQVEAVVHGIARALVKLDSEKFRVTLKKAGLLSRDPRERQRRMVGTGGKARRKKQSPKR